MRHVVKLMNLAHTRRADERRLGAWLAASVVLHGLALGLAGGFGKPAPAASEPTMLATVLQATVGPVAMPEAPSLPAPEPVTREVEPVAPVPSPSADKPLALAQKPPRGPTSAVDNSREGGFGLPLGRVTVGILHDPGDAGAAGRKVRDRFPTPAGREPRLRGALVVPYPAKALEMRLGMRMVAVATIDAQGQMTDAVFSPDDSLFAPAVLSALKLTRFYPAETGGERVPYWLMIEVVFSVDGGTRQSTARSP